MTTQVLIFADSNLHRAAWWALLERQPGIAVAGAAGELKDLARLRPEGPTAILVDMPAVQNELVSQLHAAMPDYGLLFLVGGYDLAKIVGFLQAGATGFIARDATVPDLARAIIAAGRGEVVLPPDLATKALVALARGGIFQEGRSVTLTDREQEVMELLSQGYTNKDIAQRLILSVRTVEAHLRNIYAKLEVASRTEAALWAVNHGYGSKE